MRCRDSSSDSDDCSDYESDSSSVTIGSSITAASTMDDTVKDPTYIPASVEYRQLASPRGLGGLSLQGRSHINPSDSASTSAASSEPNSVMDLTGTSPLCKSLPLLHADRQNLYMCLKRTDSRLVDLAYNIEMCLPALRGTALLHSTKDCRFEVLTKHADILETQTWEGYNHHYGAIQLDLLQHVAKKALIQHAFIFYPMLPIEVYCMPAVVESLQDRVYAVYGQLSIMPWVADRQILRQPFIMPQ